MLPCVSVARVVVCADVTGLSVDWAAPVVSVTWVDIPPHAASDKIASAQIIAARMFFLFFILDIPFLFLLCAQYLCLTGLIQYRLTLFPCFYPWQVEDQPDSHDCHKEREQITGITKPRLIDLQRCAFGCFMQKQII